MAPGDVKEINGHTFKGFGSHSDDYPCAYLTAAAAIGMTRRDVDLFIKRLDETFVKWQKKMKKDTQNKNESDEVNKLDLNVDINDTKCEWRMFIDNLLKLACYVNSTNHVDHEKVVI